LPIPLWKIIRTAVYSLALFVLYTWSGQVQNIIDYTLSQEFHIAQENVGYFVVYWVVTILVITAWLDLVRLLYRWVKGSEKSKLIPENLLTKADFGLFLEEFREFRKETRTANADLIAEIHRINRNRDTNSSEQDSP